MTTELKPDGTTTCCGAYTKISLDDGVEFCRKCYEAVTGAQSERFTFTLPKLETAP